MKRLILITTLLLTAVPTCAEDAAAEDDVAPNAATTDRGADAALAAWQAFRSAPVDSLDRTGPFLDFIRNSGQVHIVLNENLLGWMYGPLDPTRKAVLYAGFLGGNMAAQLEQGVTGSNDHAAMRGALLSYESLRHADPAFSDPFFERLLAARDDGTLEAVVDRIGAGEEPVPSP